MTIGDSNSGAMTSQINVTPMIDVLLVLLIIFMVIVPAVPKGEAALAPRTSTGEGHSDTVVLEVLKGDHGDAFFKINQQVVSRNDLPGRLAAIYANRAQRVLFLKGDDGLSFTQVAEVIDIGHAAGVDRIGVMTPGVLAGR
jgi:biopolymer transport protein ExbD